MALKVALIGRGELSPVQEKLLKEFVGGDYELVKIEQLADNPKEASKQLEGVKKAVLHQEVVDCYRSLLVGKEYRTFKGFLKYRFTREGKTEIEIDRFRVVVPLLGIGVVRSVEISLEVLKLLGLNPEGFLDAFSTFRGERGRMQPLLGEGFLVIDDTYNANPLSVKLALETLVKVEGYTKRVAILGDMLELGKEEIELHRELGRFINTLPLEGVYLYGNLTRYT